MRMFARHGGLHRRIRVDGTDDAEARRRLSVVEGIEAMRERFPAAEARRAFGVSRATRHEWRRRLREGGAAGLVPRGSRPWFMSARGAHQSSSVFATRKPLEPHTQSVSNSVRRAERTSPGSSPKCPLRR